MIRLKSAPCKKADFREMKHTSLGPFCDVCSHDVADLTEMNFFKKQLWLWRNQNTETCARFTQKKSKRSKQMGLLLAIMLWPMLAYAGDFAEVDPDLQEPKTPQRTSFGEPYQKVYGGAFVRRHPLSLLYILGRRIGAKAGLPHGLGIIEFKTDKKWDKVTVNCRSSIRSRKYKISKGIAHLRSLPPGKVCEVALHSKGHTMYTRIKVSNSTMQQEEEK